MDLDISFTKRVFFIVTLVGMVAMLVFLALTQPTGDAVKTAGTTISNSLAITGVNVGESIGKEFPALTESHLLGLATGTVQTDEGRTRYKQYIILLGSASQTSGLDSNLLSGATVVFEKNNYGEVGDFLRFNSDEDMFEYYIEFESGFQSKVEDGKLVDLREETLNIMGGQFTILDAEVDTTSHSIELKFMGPGGTVVFEDQDYTDVFFTDSGLKFNGQNLQSRVMIKGYDMGNDKFSITSIQYRPQPMPKAAGKHVYVAPKHGVQEYLKQPQIMLTPQFEIIYGGLASGSSPLGGVIADVTGSAVSTEMAVGLADLINKEGPTGNMITGAVSASGNMIWFKPSGDDQYDLIVATNNANYKFGVMSTNGGLHWGDADQDFIWTESANPAVFNIDQKDYFLVTSGNDIGQYSSIILYDSIDFAENKIQLRDLAGGTKDATFDAAGFGTVVLNGKPTDFYVSLVAPYPITVDLTQNGAINGAAAQMVTRGGVRLQFAGAGTVNVIVPRRLFHDEPPAADETTTFTIGQAGGEITLTVANQATLTLQSADGGIKYGMTNFGLEFQWLEDKEPEELKIGMPGAQIAQPFANKPYTSGGQAGSYVVVTLERSKLAKKK